MWTMTDVVHLADGEFVRSYLQAVPQDVACSPIDLRGEGKELRRKPNGLLAASLVEFRASAKPLKMATVGLLPQYRAVA